MCRALSLTWSCEEEGCREETVGESPDNGGHSSSEHASHCCPESPIPQSGSLPRPSGSTPQQNSVGPLLAALLTKLEHLLDQVLSCMGHSLSSPHTPPSSFSPPPLLSSPPLHLSSSFTSPPPSPPPPLLQPYEVNLLLTSIFSSLAAFSHPMVDWLFDTHCKHHTTSNVYTVLKKVRPYSEIRPSSHSTTLIPHHHPHHTPPPSSHTTTLIPHHHPHPTPPPSSHTTTPLASSHTTTPPPSSHTTTLPCIYTH